jgi:hypothetical protein
MALTSLRLEDYSDREVLLILQDITGPDGWADSLEVAERIGLQAEHPRRTAASRLSWLQRYGAVEREFARDADGVIRLRRDGRPVYTQRWRLTDRGRTLAAGTLTSRQQESLERMATDDRLLLITRWLTEVERSTDDVAATLMKREWRYGVHPLRAVNGNGPG